MPSKGEYHDLSKGSLDLNIIRTNKFLVQCSSVYDDKIESWGAEFWWKLGNSKTARTFLNYNQHFWSQKAPSGKNIETKLVYKKFFSNEKLKKVNQIMVRG